MYALAAERFGFMAVQRAYEHAWGWLAFDLFFMLLMISEAAKSRTASG